MATRVPVGRVGIDPGRVRRRRHRQGVRVVSHRTPVVHPGPRSSTARTSRPIRLRRGDPFQFLGVNAGGHDRDHQVRQRMCPVRPAGSGRPRSARARRRRAGRRPSPAPSTAAAASGSGVQVAQEISIGSHGRSISTTPRISTASRTSASVSSTASAAATSTPTPSPCHTWTNACPTIRSSDLARAPAPAGCDRRPSGPAGPSDGLASRPHAASSILTFGLAQPVARGPAIDRRNCSRSAQHRPTGQRTGRGQLPDLGIVRRRAPGHPGEPVPWPRSGPGGPVRRAPRSRPSRRCRPGPVRDSRSSSIGGRRRELW